MTCVSIRARKLRGNVILPESYIWDNEHKLEAFDVVKTEAHYIAMAESLLKENGKPADVFISYDESFISSLAETDEAELKALLSSLSPVYFRRL